MDAQESRPQVDDLHLAVLFPVSYLLWLSWYDRDHKLVLLTLSMPVLFAYVIPVRFKW